MSLRSAMTPEGRMLLLGKARIRYPPLVSLAQAPEINPLATSQAPATGRELGIRAASLGRRRVDDLQRAETGHWTVHQEHLDRQVGLDMGLAEEGQHIASREDF